MFVCVDGIKNGSGVKYLFRINVCLVSDACVV